MELGKLDIYMLQKKIRPVSTSFHKKQTNKMSKFQMDQRPKCEIWKLWEKKANAQYDINLGNDFLNRDNICKN